MNFFVENHLPSQQSVQETFDSTVSYLSELGLDVAVTYGVKKAIQIGAPLVLGTSALSTIGLPLGVSVGKDIVLKGLINQEFSLSDVLNANSDQVANYVTEKACGIVLTLALDAALDPLLEMAFRDTSGIKFYTNEIKSLYTSNGAYGIFKGVAQ